MSQQPNDDLTAKGQLIDKNMTLAMSIRILQPPGKVLEALWRSSFVKPIPFRISMALICERFWRNFDLNDASFPGSGRMTDLVV